MITNDIKKMKTEELAVLYALGELDPDTAFTVEMELIKYPELMAKVRDIQSMDDAFSVALSQQPIITEEYLDEEDSEEETTATQEESTGSAAEPSPAETIGIHKPETTIAASKPIYKSFWMTNAAVLALIVLGGILLFPMFTKTTPVAENDPNAATNVGDVNSGVKDNDVGNGGGTGKIDVQKTGSGHSGPLIPAISSSVSTMNLDFFKNEILTKGQVPNVGEDAEEDLLESFSPENRKVVEDSVTKFINLLKDPQAKAQDFKDIAAELSKLNTAENNKELQAFISIVNKASEIVQ